MSDEDMIICSDADREQRVRRRSAKRVVEVLPPVRPVVKWVGGKSQLMDCILPILRAQQREVEDRGLAPQYFEPFVGGGAMFCGMRGLGFAGAAVLADVNEELVRMYRGIQIDPDGVVAAVREWHERIVSTTEIYGASGFRKLYNHARAVLPASLSDVEVAARMIFLNKTSFNGLYRVNQNGRFNAPPDMTRVGRYVLTPAGAIRSMSEALRGVRLDVSEFGKVLEMAGDGSVVYADPPYYRPAKVLEGQATTKGFVSYSPGGFEFKDHVRLHACCEAARSRGAHVVVSHADTPEIRELYSSTYDVRQVSARRSINSDGAGRGPVFELVCVGPGRLGL